jgi:hypothetical protein
MAALDPVNSAFERKIQLLNKSINQLQNLVGSDPPKGAMGVILLTINSHILDLYQVNREYYIIMNQLRNEIVNVSQKREVAQKDIKVHIHGANGM